jgi:protein SCO1
VDVNNRIQIRISGLLAAASMVLAAGFSLAPPARAQFTDPTQNIGVRPELLKQVGIDQKLNQQIPLGLTFRDENGKTVELRQYFGQKPVILSLVYFTCPMLCTQVLNGLNRSLKLQSLDVGKDFSVLTVSIDPSDTVTLAAAKHELYSGIYGRPGGAEGWHFLTGEESQIKSLADAVGFRYAYDAESKQFAHASCIIVLTPDGKISRYLYGITYPHLDLRLALTEASDGKIGEPVENAILLYCYHYDPNTGKYGLLISHVIQAAGGLTVLAIGTMLLILFRREHYALPEKKA